MANIGIFRLQLFKPSEGFITAQTNAFSRYQPIFIGRKVFGTSENNIYVVPSPFNKSFSGFFKHLAILFFRCPNPYVELLSNIELDLIHAHFAIDGVGALPLSKKCRLPLVVTLHGMDVTRTSWDMLKSASPNLVNYVLFKSKLIRNANLFVCVSEFIRQAAISKGFPENKLLVHYIGIDTKKLTKRDDAGEDGLVLHVGRLVEKKGTTYLIDAFASIIREMPSAKLIIIGDGPLKSMLMNQTQALGLTNSISFLGVQPNGVVLDWVRRASVMAVPSVTASDGDMEGFGIVNIEASAQGVPVVGFRSGGIPEAVISGKTGFLSEERDVAGLTESILLLLKNKELRLKIGNAGRENVEANFDLHKQSSKLEKIYDQLIQNNTHYQLTS